MEHVLNCLSFPYHILCSNKCGVSTKNIYLNTAMLIMLPQTMLVGQFLRSKTSFHILRIQMCAIGRGMSLTLSVLSQITSPDDLGAVTVRALMPGGIEPVDPLISGDSQAQTTCFLDNLQIRFRFWYWPLCPRQVSCLHNCR